MWIWLDFQIFLFVRFVRILSKTHSFYCLISYAHFQCKCMHLKRLYCFIPVFLRIFLLVSIYCSVLHIILKKVKEVSFFKKNWFKICLLCFIWCNICRAGEIHQNSQLTMYLLYYVQRRWSSTLRGYWLGRWDRPWVRGRGPATGSTVTSYWRLTVPLSLWARTASSRSLSASVSGQGLHLYIHSFLFINKHIQ